jgi:drug/metabolite transporter (DMT)-like permease
VYITIYSVTDVTAIWNTNAFFAYVITVKLFKMEWETRKLIAVSLATLGTLGVVYGGVENAQLEHEDAKRALVGKPSAPLLGDLLTLVASFGYGLYQVLYKKYCALPNDPEVIHHATYQPIFDANEPNIDSDPDPPVPYGLHPNLLTTGIGVMTFLTLWIPLPFLHYFGIESFALPKDLRTVLAISGICLSGVVFNSGFMVSSPFLSPFIGHRRSNLRSASRHTDPPGSLGSNNHIGG